jgi:hypothetical protein
VAAEVKTTNWPPAARYGSSLPPLPWVPSEATLARTVVSVSRSWTNTSVLPLVSPGTRSDAADWKAT